MGKKGRSLFSFYFFLLLLAFLSHVLNPRANSLFFSLTQSFTERTFFFFARLTENNIILFVRTVLCRRFDFIHIALHCLLPENEREETNRFLNDTMGCMKKGAHEGKAYTERKEDSDSQCVL